MLHVSFQGCMFNPYTTWDAPPPGNTPAKTNIDPEIKKVENKDRLCNSWPPPELYITILVGWIL